MTYYTLAGVSYAPAPHPVHGIVFQKAARKSTLNTGDTKVVNGVTYTFNENRRWTRADKKSRSRRSSPGASKRPPNVAVPVLEDAPKVKGKSRRMTPPAAPKANTEEIARQARRSAPRAMSAEGLPQLKPKGKPAQVKPKAKAEAKPKASSGDKTKAVLEAANATQTGRLGDSKVFISHVWDTVQKQHPGMFKSREDFNKHLLEANRKRDMDLSRADMAYALNQDDVNNSELTHQNSSYHFIRLDGDTPPAKAEAKPKAKAEVKAKAKATKKEFVVPDGYKEAENDLGQKRLQRADGKVKFFSGEEEGVKATPLHQIIPIKHSASDEEINEIAEDLKAGHQYAVPVAVLDGEDNYKLVSGGAILEAAKRAGLKRLNIHIIPEDSKRGIPEFSQEEFDRQMKAYKGEDQPQDAGDLQAQLAELQKQIAKLQAENKQLQAKAGAGANANTSGPKINSAKEFESEAMKIYDRLNEDYNLGDLVPIYRIRRELGDRLSRSQFKEWLMEMQANDQVQLMGGQVPGVTQDQREDSVTIPGGGLRFYVQRL